MRVWIKNNCPRTVQLLLCLFILAFVGCSSLKNVENKCLQSSTSILQLAVHENDFSRFNQSIQALGLVAIDFRPANMNRQNIGDTEFYITFQFFTRSDFLVASSAIMSTGLASRINYKY